MSAKNMFYKEGFDFSNSEEKKFAREELIYNVTEDLLVILEDMEISKKELARRLGKSRSYVTQVLDGSRNMTLGSLSDICFALGIKPKIELPVQNEPEKFVRNFDFDDKWLYQPLLAEGELEINRWLSQFVLPETYTQTKAPIRSSANVIDRTDKIHWTKEAA